MDEKNSFIPVKGDKSVLELDRFKRRLIRSVARLSLRDKKPDTEVWEILKRDTGCNCKLLWSRMRALTLKKLEHHLIAEDCVDRVPSRAKMNLTDWMMVDLVLVHQDLDFIGQKLNVNKQFKALDELFNLVNMFGIEGLKSDDLADAWSSATLYYNKNGHQCSPMLLQKRWYQMKAITRNKFYKFWYAYKGCIKRLYVAEPYKPTPLEHAIARRYKKLITSPHLSWEELIEQRLVTLPDEFAMKMMERAGFPMDMRRQSFDDDSDLELVEPKIETIDLRQESDDTPQGVDETLPQIVRVKQEPPDPDLEPVTQAEIPKKSIYEEVLESTLKENQVIDAILTGEYFDVCDDTGDEVEEVDLEEKEETMMPQITCVFSNVSEGNLDKYSGTDKNTLSTGDGIDNDTAKLDDAGTLTAEVDVEPVVVDNQTSIVDVDGQTETVEESDVIQLCDVEENNDVDDKVDDVTAPVKIDSKTVTVQDENDTSTCKSVDNVANTSKSNDESNVTVLVTKENAQNKDSTVFEEIQAANLVTPSSSEDKIVNNDSIPKVILVQTENKILKDSEDEENISRPVIITDSEDEPHSDTIVEVMDTTLDDSTEHAMEITEVEGDDEIMNDDVDSKANVKIDGIKFSFGELPQEFSFVDDGIELADDGIAFDDYDDHIEIKTEPVTEEPKIDPKLLMLPVVYATRLDDLNIFRKVPFDQIRNKNIIDAVINKSPPIKQEKPSEKGIEDITEDMPITLADDNNENMSADDDSDDSVVPENIKVKPTSYLLQKPRSRSYNPIQLCKNPDFNTRLKRLTVGFFKSHRNRALIKHCKPLTVDISKAFETKLIKGTLYLKPTESSDYNIKTEIIDDSEIVQNATVVPSAMIAQSLIDNTKTADILPLIHEVQIAPKPVEHERNTRINLPDISEIRRINQRLLTAEITPIQIQNKNCQAPVTLISNVEPSQSPAVSSDTPDVTEILSVASDNSSCQLDNSLPESSTRGQASYLRGRGRPTLNGRRSLQQKPKSRTIKSYTAISWLSKSNDPNILSKEQDCTLLTLDTLNKMLNVLGDKEGPSETQKKPKGSIEKIEKKMYKTNQKIKNNVTQVENKIETGVCKPRINVKSAINGPCKYKSRKKQETGTMTETIDEQAQKRKDLYCCWSRQRMLQKIFFKKAIPEHECQEGNCVCCCRKLLLSYIAQDEQIKLARQRADKNKAMIECAEAANACANLNKDIPGDADNRGGPAVTKVPATEIILPPVPIVTIDSAESDIRPHERTLDLENEASVDISSNEPVTTIVTTSPLIQNASASENPTITVPIVDTLPRSIIEVHPVTPADLNLTKSESLKTYGNSIVKKNRSTKLNKPFKLPKFSKEKFIFLNSKHISEKPTKSPIYLGKNKVLMTTVKFPWNLKLFEETKKALGSTLKLPTGVSLVCLADGTISYSIDNVHVKALDLALMPSIIATVQMHMNNALINQQQSDPKQNVQPTVNSNEVIDLVDDEDENNTESHPETKNSQNTNEIKDATNLSETTCIQHYAQESSQENILVVSEAQLFQTDLSRADASQSQEVTIAGASNQSDVPNSTSECQLQLTSLENANLKVYAITSTEDQIKLGPPNQAENIEDAQELRIEPGQPKENEDKVEQQVMVEQDKEQAQPGPSIQLERGNVDAEHIHQPKKTKNILSDLMEMSGIFDDDVTPAPQETMPTPSQQDVAPQSILSQLASVVQPVGTSKQQGTLLGPMPNYLSCLPLIKTPLGDLSPITSLYELKYACANKGIFFKLDFDTGYLVPINVCLKEPVKQKTKVVAQRTVIDLTKDGKSNQSEPNSKGNISLLAPRIELVAGTEGEGSPVKPCSLVKVSIPSILRRLNADNKCEENINKLIKVYGDKTSKRKRKQHLRVQQCDVSDSEDNIAQSSPRKTAKRSRDTDTQESSASTYRLQKDEVTTVYDSSDDEPLSKVAKLKRQDKNKRTTRIVIDLPANEQNEQLPNNLETQENISELGRSYSSDEDEENCILGV